MYTRQQIAGAKAIDHVKCLALGKSSLERLVGPVEDRLQRGGVCAALRIRRAACGSPRRVKPPRACKLHALPAGGMHACVACMLRAKLYWGTANPGFAANPEFATPPTRKPPFWC